MDSILDQGGLVHSQRSKGNFLFSAATANSTMDYSAKVIEDGVVDSPPSRGHVSQVVSSPSPLRVKTKAAASILRSPADSRSFRKLYDSPRPVIREVLVISFSTIPFVTNHSFCGYCICSHVL
jgi:hypothetical protein